MTELIIDENPKLRIGDQEYKIEPADLSYTDSRMDSIYNFDILSLIKSPWQMESETDEEFKHRILERLSQL